MRVKKEQPVQRNRAGRAFGAAAVLLAAVLLTAPAVPAFGDEQAGKHHSYTLEELGEIAEGIVDWKKEEEGLEPEDDLLSGDFLEQAGSSAGDWYPLAMGRLGMEDDYTSYLAVLRADVEERYRTEGGLDPSKATEWQRIALAVLACGGDPTEFGTQEDGTPIDLIADGSYDRGKTAPLDQQGINGLIWGLLTMDAMRYEIPQQAADTRDTVIQSLLERQGEDGGFSLTGTASAADVTAMAVQALAPYYNSPQIYTWTDGDGKEREKSAGQAVDEALDWLSGQQNADGNFGEAADSETCAQVITALCALGLDPEEDTRFIKDGVTVLDGLMTFAGEDGGFIHSQVYDEENPASSPERSNSMAGEQALCAVTSVLRLRQDMRAFYDFRPEMDDALKEEIGALEKEIDALEEAGEGGGERAEELFARYLEIPVFERCYVSNYKALAAAREASGTADTGEALSGGMGTYTSGSGTVTDVLGDGAKLSAGTFGESDVKAYEELPEPVTTEQYTAVVSLLEKLEQSGDADQYAEIEEGLKEKREQIEEIRKEIEAINAEVLEKLYPLERISLSDKKEVESILERIGNLEPYDRQQVLRYEDIQRAAVQVENQQRAVWIGAACGAAAILAAAAVILRIRRRRANRRAFYAGEEEDGEENR